MNILLVEDNDIDVMIFQRALRKADTPSKIVRARDGLEALEILTDSHQSESLQAPFVILLDINMPRMNGHEFMKELRSNRDISYSRVVVVTTSDDPRDIELAYAHHASGYVIKPNELAGMKDVITSLHNYWNICKNPLPGSSRPQA